MKPELVELFKKAQGKMTREAIELRQRILRQVGFLHPQTLAELQELAERI